MSVYPARRARGYIVLALTIVLAATSSFHLIRRLHAEQRDHAKAETRAALADARAALIGYAASYPDRVNARFGPGYLPCPARRSGGVAGPACSVSGQTTVGYFPWHTLRTRQTFDGSGAALWYAVDQSFRYNPKKIPHNNETSGALDVDGEAVVAVVIAPGHPLAGQLQRVRRPLARDQFLEGPNAGASLEKFATSNDESGNDIVAAITTRDIWRAAEARVLSGVKQALLDYASNNHGRFPWLAPYDNPLIYSPQSAVGTREGLLAFHYYDSPDGAVADRFQTQVSLDWRLANTEPHIESGNGRAYENCVIAIPCVDHAGAVRIDRLDGVANCLWWAPVSDKRPHRYARCSLRAALHQGSLVYNYVVDFSIENDETDPAVKSPTPGAPRVRNITTSRFLAMGSAVNTIHITLTVTKSGSNIAVLRLSARPHTEGYFRAAGIRYDLDVNRGEIPAWLVDNGWHRQLLISWAEAACIVDESCLNLTRTGNTPGERESHPPVRAVVVLAGPPLADAPPRTVEAGPNAWFENHNQPQATRSLAFEYSPPRRAFNDRLRVIGAL